MFCHKCGSPLPDESVFCPDCGVNTKTVSAVPSQPAPAAKGSATRQNARDLARRVN
jgi:uncharacterized Zn finger protein (UPF0148 family)